MDRNPYTPPKADSEGADASRSADERSVASHSPGEYVLLASLAGSWVFWAYFWLFGTIKFQGSSVGAVALLLGFLGAGAIAFWLILRRRLSGAILCSVFYGVQIVSVTRSSGESVGINSLPTINIWVYGDEASPVNLNLVALILLVPSLVLCDVYRRKRTDAA